MSRVALFVLIAVGFTVANTLIMPMLTNKFEFGQLFHQLFGAGWALFVSYLSEREDNTQ